MDRRELERRAAAGEVFEYLFFWGAKGQHLGEVDASCLSQWHPSSFEVDGKRYATAEHYMMAGKARLFGDREIEAKILASDDPREAKGLGRKVRGFEAARWQQACVGIVVDGNVAKFTQHRKLRAFLLGTGETILVEASPLDTIWGIGLGKENPKALDPRSWRGTNLLGFALMDVRGKLGAA